MSFNKRLDLRTNIFIGCWILIVCIFYGYYMMGPLILPTNVEHWESSGGDNTQHYIGWLAYREDNWHWPLTYTDRINNPTGASIVFTDSIPLFAVLGKIFQSLLPDNFQYFSLFILLAYILQYSFGFLLLRYFCPNSLLIPLLAASFFLMSPILNSRIGVHESLTAHWLILASIYLYCQSLKPTWNRWIVPSFGLLIFLSLGIHFYLASMVIFLGIATLFEDLWLKKKSWSIWLKILVLLLVFFISLYFWGYFLGYARVEGGQLWSLNLNSFINSRNVSKFMPGLPIQSGQHEGFAYLGLGVLILLPFSIFISIRPSLFSYSSRWLPLMIVTSFLAIYALGNKVYFGEILIVELPDFSLLKKVHSVLHATGRFVWPFYYCFLLWIIISISSIKNRYFVVGLLVASLLIQISDLSPLKASPSVLSNNQPLIFPENSLKEIKNMKEYTKSRYFWILPTAYCPGGLGYKDKSLLFAAVKSHLITNEINAARRMRNYYQNNCHTIKKFQKINQLKKDTLYAIKITQVSMDFLQDINKTENRNKCKALPKENWLLCHRQDLFPQS